MSFEPLGPENSTFWVKLNDLDVPELSFDEVPRVAAVQCLVGHEVGPDSLDLSVTGTVGTELMHI